MESENVHLLVPINAHEHHHKTGIWKRFVVIGICLLLVGMLFLSLSLTLKIKVFVFDTELSSFLGTFFHCNFERFSPEYLALQPVAILLDARESIRHALCLR
jgi:hypothetical protein